MAGGPDPALCGNPFADIIKAAGIDARIYMREELNNLDAAPDMHDWLIGRLTKKTNLSQPPQGR